MTLTLFGLGFCPLLVGRLLHILDWRWVFAIFIIPGLLLAWATWRLVPTTAVTAAGDVSRSPLHDWQAVLGYRHIRVLMACMLCWLTCLVTTSAFMPSYLLNHLKLSFGAMGIVMSAIGFGAAAGTLFLPWLSDFFGRTTIMLFAALGAGLSLAWLNFLGAVPIKLFAALFAVHVVNNALITLTVGPVCSETVPPKLMATASGMVIAAGELFGGDLAPIVAGEVADNFGIAHLLWLPMAAMGLGFILCMLVQKTHTPPPLTVERELWIPLP